MLEVDFQSDIAQALKKLNTVSFSEMPKIVAHAQNKTMATIRSQEKKRIKEVFDRPTPYAVNAPYTVPATPERLEVTMRMRDFSSKGVPAEKFMAPEIYGGQRSMKASEKALRAANILPPGMFIVPSKEAETYGLLDRYGNLRGSFINRVLSYLRANRDGTQNRAGKGKAKNMQFFAISKPNPRHLPLGIYQRWRGSFRLVIAFVKEPHYKKRYDYFETAESITHKYFLNDLKAAIDYAVEHGTTVFASADLAAILSAFSDQ